MATDVVILSAVRTAVGTFGGTLAPVPAVKLGEIVVREALTRAGAQPAQVDELILGCVLQAGLGQNVARQVLIEQCAGSEVEMGIYITGAGRIQELNRNYRKKDQTTDVLSFAFFPEPRAPSVDGSIEFVLPPDGVLRLGEVVISFPQAEAQAVKYGHAVKRELARLLMHGVLHLLGYDHEKPSDCAIMEEREKVILSHLAAVLV